jgi:predicted transcriptional regulator
MLGMEVHLNPDVEKRLNDLAEQSGRATDELLQDALAGYLVELAQTRETLDRRYDELKSGNVKAILADDVEAHFRDKSAAARRSR